MITGLSRFCNVCLCPLGAAPSCAACAPFSYVSSVCQAPLSSRDTSPPVNEKYLQSVHGPLRSCVYRSGSVGTFRPCCY